MGKLYSTYINGCKRRAWREWAPFCWHFCKCSRHNFAVAKGQTPRTTTPHVASLSVPAFRPSGLPVALSAPRHGDFPRSIFGSELLVCALRGRASSALQTANLWSKILLQMSTCWHEFKYSSSDCPQQNHVFHGIIADPANSSTLKRPLSPK